MRAEIRVRDNKNRVRRGATPTRPARQPLDFGPALARVRSLPWRWMALSLLVPTLMVLLYQGISQGIQRLDRNIGVIEISGDFKNVSQEELHRELVYLTDQSFFAVDLREAQDRIESLPWIETSRVQRVWPNKLHFWVKEHNPIALWGETQLLSQNGEVFEPADRGQYAHLPQLRGPAGSQETLWLNYIRWNEELAALQLTVAGISLAERGAWEIQMREGMLIKLGRDDLDGKMDRLQQIFQAQLHDKIPEIEVLDVRYANGLAVRWKEQTNNG